VILVLSTLGGCNGVLNVKVMVLFTGTPMAVSAGSEDDISKFGALDANLYARSIAIDVADIYYYIIILKRQLT